MALHGHSKIELFDAKTGAPIRTVEDDNLITNFVRDIMSNITPGLPSPLLVNANTKELLDIDNLFGGIKIYSEPLNEDPDDYYQSSKNIVGHADNLTYSDVDTSRGSYNTALSEKGSNYVKKVWDFTAEQSNGTIASVGLTSIIGGRIGGPTELPAVINENSIVNLMSDVTLSARVIDDTKHPYSMINNNPRPVYFDADRSKLYAIGYQTTGTDLVSYEFELPTLKHSLFEQMYYYLNTSAVVAYLLLNDHTSTSVINCSDIFTSVYNQFFSISDGSKVYLISGTNSGTTANTYIASGQSRDIKVYDVITKQTSSYKFTNNTGHIINYSALGVGTINNGYLYVATRDNFLAYINMNNNGDCGLVLNPEGEPLVMANITLPAGMKVSDMFVVSTNGILASTTANARCYYVYDVYKTKYLNVKNFNALVASGSGAIGCSRENLNLFKGCTSYTIYQKTTSGTAIYYMLLYSFINWNALMTINNLEAPVTKTADMTMRITYTITEVE